MNALITQKLEGNARWLFDRKLDVALDAWYTFIPLSFAAITLSSSLYFLWGGGADYLIGLSVVLSVIVLVITRIFLSLFKKQIFRKQCSLVRQTIAANSSAYTKQLEVLYAAAEKITNVFLNGDERLDVPKPANGVITQEQADDFRALLFEDLLRYIDFVRYDMVFSQYGVSFSMTTEPEGGFRRLTTKANIHYSRIPQFATITIYGDGTIKCYKGTHMTAFEL